MPVCAYVAKLLTGHGEFTDLVDEVTPDVLQWLETELG